MSSFVLAKYNFNANELVRPIDIFQKTLTQRKHYTSASSSFQSKSFDFY